jgi:hypothetical protein
MVYPKATTFIEKTEATGGRIPTPPGISEERDNYTYQRVFFGAQREWPNDEVGWTRVPATKAIYKTIGGEKVRIMVRVNRRDINYMEWKHAGWNLADLE